MGWRRRLLVIALVAIPLVGVRGDWGKPWGLGGWGSAEAGVVWDSGPALKPPQVYRVVGDDDDDLKQGLDRLEAIYGARLIIIPGNYDEIAEGDIRIDGKTLHWVPAKNGPYQVDGIVVHNEPYDEPKWVIGYDPLSVLPQGQISLERNPLLAFEAVNEAISKKYPDIGDLGDKWFEYLFLSRTAGKLAEPLTRLATDPALAVSGNLSDIDKLEAIRRKIEEVQGKSIVKIRDGFHSEGRLPKTSDNWARFYLDQKDGKKTLEGEVLTQLLQKPENVIVQRMLKAAKEVRVHIINGEILQNATFLRMYPLGAYLTPGEITRLHEAVRHEFLDPLPPEFKKFAATMDVIIDEEGNYSIIDLNAGLESGYYFPSEDLFTTAYYDRYFSGKGTVVLEDFERFTAEPLGPAKVALLKDMLRKYKPFLKGDVLEAFWDRVLRHYRDLIEEDPSPERLSELLRDLRRAGLRKASIYDEFLAEIKSEWPAVQLTAADRAKWRKYLLHLDPKVGSSLDGIFNPCGAALASIVPRA